jgi:arabinan endo-1,5-alpha-L-arabinosidase
MEAPMWRLLLFHAESRLQDSRRGDCRAVEVVCRACDPVQEDAPKPHYNMRRETSMKHFFEQSSKSLQAVWLVLFVAAVVAGCGGGSGTTTPPITTVATPLISPAGGSYSTAQTVTITDSTSAATIYYTIDGTTPTTSSTKYTAALSVSSTETIKAIATATGDTNSAVATASYTFTPDMGTIVNVQYPVSAYDTNQYQIQNAATGKVLGISQQSQLAGASVVEEDNTSSTDSMWHFMQQVDTGTDYRANIENMLTHQVIAFSSDVPSNGVTPPAALLAGAQALQFSNTGNDDQNWVLYKLTDGNFLLKNHGSGLYLQYDSTTTTIDQGARSTTSSSAGCICQEWTLTSTGTPAYTAPLTVQGTGMYVHDPNMIQDPVSHVYWLYGTHQTIAYSTDFSTFTDTTGTSAYGACGSTQASDDWLTQDGRCADIGPDFTSWSGLQTPPSDNNGGNTDLWAPSTMYANGTYYQYYSIPVEPDTVGGEAIIGLATSSTAYGPWADKGWIIASWSNTVNTPLSGFGFSNTTKYNAIDPAPFIDADGNWWLVFGSWLDGTHIVQLDPSTGLRLASNNTLYNIAHRWWGEEGPFIYPHVVNGTQYYYYFAPVNACCGATSPYRIIYGRSTSPTGPYVDRGGVPLYAADGGGGGTILLSAHGRIVGPGGQSVFTDTGTDGSKSLPTLVYHYYDGDANGTPKLGINRLAFTSDGWPYVQ